MFLTSNLRANLLISGLLVREKGKGDFVSTKRPNSYITLHKPLVDISQIYISKKGVNVNLYALPPNNHLSNTTYINVYKFKFGIPKSPSGIVPRRELEGFEFTIILDVIVS